MNTAVLGFIKLIAMLVVPPLAVGVGAYLAAGLIWGIAGAVAGLGAGIWNVWGIWQGIRLR